MEVSGFVHHARDCGISSRMRRLEGTAWYLTNHPHVYACLCGACLCGVFRCSPIQEAECWAVALSTTLATVA